MYNYLYPHRPQPTSKLPNLQSQPSQSNLAAQMTDRGGELQAHPVLPNLLLRPERVYVQHNGAIKIDVMSVPDTKLSSKAGPGASKSKTDVLYELAYQAPELFNFGKNCPDDDVYALGIMCLEVSERVAWSVIEQSGVLSHQHLVPRGAKSTALCPTTGLHRRS